MDGAGDVGGRGLALEAQAPKWAGALFGFELTVVPTAPPAPRFAAPPSTPAAERDLALVLPPGVLAEQVERVLRDAGGSLLESTRVFDEYRSAGLPGRSVAWRLVFRAPDRTLRDADVSEAVDRILGALKEELGVERRAS